MKKTIKMVLYGEPGVGKSVFALGFPKPYFITTDGNYGWLETFGAKDEDHKQVSSWSDAKKEFAQPLEKYDTIVIDLIEDLFKWCEMEYCSKNKISHVSDMGYGKGYDCVASDFMNEITKLFSREDKNIILLSHALTKIEKNARGVEKTIYVPSDRIREKVWEQIEGRVQFFNRAYIEEEVRHDEKGNEYVVNNRVLSLIKKPEEKYSILRNVSEDAVPRDIALDYKTFVSVIESHLINRNKSTLLNDKEVSSKVVSKLKEKKETTISNSESKPKDIPAPIKKEVEIKKDIKVEAENNKEEIPASPKIENGGDRLAAMKAKLAALKAKRQAN